MTEAIDLKTAKSKTYAREFGATDFLQASASNNKEFLPVSEAQKHEKKAMTRTGTSNISMDSCTHTHPHPPTHTHTRLDRIPALGRSHAKQQQLSGQQQQHHHQQQQRTYSRKNITNTEHLPEAKTWKLNTSLSITSIMPFVGRVRIFLSPKPFKPCSVKPNTESGNEVASN